MEEEDRWAKKRFPISHPPLAEVVEEVSPRGSRVREENSNFLLP